MYRQTNIVDVRRSVGETGGSGGRKAAPIVNVTLGSRDMRGIRSSIDVTFRRIMQLAFWSLAARLEAGQRIPFSRNCGQRMEQYGACGLTGDIVSR
jgi:hypothetical protein